MINIVQLENRLSYSFENSLFEIMVVLLPLLQQYFIFPLNETLKINIGDICVLFSIVFLFFKNIKNIKIINKKFTFLSFFMVLLTFCDLLIFNNGFKIISPLKCLIRIIMNYLMITLVFQNMNYDRCYGYYKKACNIILLYFYMQFLFFYIFKFFLKPNFLFPFLNVEQAYGYDLMIAKDITYFRPCSLFLEPAWMCQYLIFYFIDCIENKKIVNLLFTSMAIILSTSTMGILVMISCFFADIFYVKRKLSKRQIKHAIFILFLFCLVMVVLFNSSFYDLIENRLTDENNGSTNLRVKRGIEIILNMNPLHLITGVGFGNVANYLIINDLQTKYDENLNYDQLEYMSSFTYIIICGGIFTLACIMYIIYGVLHVNNKYINLKLLSVIIIFLGASIFNSGQWVVYVTLIIILLKRAKDENRKIGG